MNNIERKRRLTHEVLVVLAIAALMSFITRLWPILLLIMACMPICALRLLYLKFKTVEVIVPISASEPPPPETEASITQKAFGLLQRRITEHLEARHPGARWIWGVPDAVERFLDDGQLTILLKNAAGYNKAHVVVNGMLFNGLKYVSLEDDTAESRDVPADSERSADMSELYYADVNFDGMAVNYSRLAFDWVDANMVGINAKYNEAIAGNETEMLIPATDLPHPDSWPAVCDELKHNGFDLADFCEDGIKVNITQ